MLPGLLNKAATRENVADDGGAWLMVVNKRGMGIVALGYGKVRKAADQILQEETEQTESGG